MMCWGLWLEKTMKNASIPYAAILISGLTLAYSMYVAFALTGNVFGNVKIVQLEPYGGVTASHLKNLEFWRLFVSQLIHAKQLHMLYNVSCLALLGICLARYVSDIGFFWLSLDARFGVAYAHRKSIAARLFLATHSHYNFSFIP
jgi:membrane associated rhomboid family serine protease